MQLFLKKEPGINAELSDERIPKFLGFLFDAQQRATGWAKRILLCFCGRRREGACVRFFLKLVEKGGTEENVNGLFRTDFARAIESVRRLLTENTLTGEAQIAAAWNIYKVQRNESILSVFIRFFCRSGLSFARKSGILRPGR